MYPSVTNIRDVTAHIAEAVIREAQRRGLDELEKPAQYATLGDWVRASMWTPAHSPIIARNAKDSVDVRGDADLC